MGTGRKGVVDRQLRTLFEAGVSGALTDSELIGRFVADTGAASERAFETLLERHGPMVFRVCRAIVRNEQDARDAFQAVFVVLARRAGSLRVRDSVGPWLHGVAYRVALHARSANDRRRKHERRKAEMQAVSVSESLSNETAAALHEEIERLPTRYRTAVVLFDLEGMSLEQAALRIGCPVGTVKSRLARGRDRLRDRLRRRGFGPASGAVWPGFLPGLSLVESTRATALTTTAGPFAGKVSPATISLVSGVLSMMRWQRGITRLATCVAVAVAGFGMATATGLVRVEEPAQGRPDQEAPVPARAVRLMPSEVQYSFHVMVINAPGLSLRASGFDFDFAVKPWTGLAFLSEMEAELLLDRLLSTTGTNAMQSPKVTPLRLDQPLTFSFPFADKTLDPKGGMAWPAKVVLKEPERDQPEIGKVAIPGRAHHPDRPFEGGNISIVTQPAKDEQHVSLDVNIEDSHVVQVHRLDVPDGAPNLSGERVEVPEIIHRDIDQRVTIPASGGHVLLSLGLYRTVDDAGKPSIIERLVLIGVRRIFVPAEVGVRF